MKIVRLGQFSLVQLDAELSIANALAVQEELLKLFSSTDKGNKREWVFNLAGLEVFDKTGLGVLVNLATVARAQGDRLLLYAATPEILELLATTELLGFFPLIQDEEDLISRLPD